MAFFKHVWGVYDYPYTKCLNLITFYRLLWPVDHLPLVLKSIGGVKTNISKNKMFFLTMLNDIFGSGKWSTGHRSQ